MSSRWQKYCARKLGQADDVCAFAGAFPNPVCGFIEVAVAK
jgi:hypothetical protein